MFLQLARELEEKGIVAVTGAPKEHGVLEALTDRMGGISSHNLEGYFCQICLFCGDLSHFVSTVIVHCASKYTESTAWVTEINLVMFIVFTRWGLSWLVESPAFKTRAIVFYL